MLGCLLYVVQLVVNLIGSTKLLHLPQGKGGAEGGGEELDKLVSFESLSMEACQKSHSLNRPSVKPCVPNLVRNTIDDLTVDILSW